jgi:hypothetical protein
MNEIINVFYGKRKDSPSFAGKTVKEIREHYSKAWDLPNDAVAIVGRERLDDNSILESGQNLEFCYLFPRTIKE